MLTVISGRILSTMGCTSARSEPSCSVSESLEHCQAIANPRNSESRPCAAAGTLRNENTARRIELLQVNGEIRLRLYKGSVYVLGRISEEKLNSEEDASMDSLTTFDPSETV